MAIVVMVGTGFALAASSSQGGVSLSTDSGAYAQGQPITVTATNTGSANITYADCVVPMFFFSVYDASGSLLITTNPGIEGATCFKTLQPGQTVSANWGQHVFANASDYYGGQAQPGVYTIAFAGASVQVTITGNSFSTPTPSPSQVATPSPSASITPAPSATPVPQECNPARVCIYDCVRGYHCNSCGECVPYPSPTPVPGCFCPMIYEPVCGVDGNTYGNSCQAQCSGVAVAYNGMCGSPNPVPPQPPEQQSFTLEVNPRWNLFSVPVYTEQNGVKATRVQTNGCDVEGVWSYDPSAASYQKIGLSDVVAGKGYWLLSGRGYCQITFAGQAELTADAYSQALLPGWNMIGAPQPSVSFSSIVNDCEVRSGPWQWNGNSYFRSDTLVAGKGYWVKAYNECTLAQPSPPQGSPTPKACNASNGNSDCPSGQVCWCPPCTRFGCEIACTGQGVCAPPIKAQ